MFTPDIRTLFLILLFVNIMLALLLFIFWKSQKTYNGFSVWMLSLLLVSCGYLLYADKGSLPFPAMAGNLMIVVAVMLRLESIWRFYKEKPLPIIVYSVLVPVTLLILWFKFVDDFVIVRGAIIGALIVPSFVATALIALRAHEPATRSLRYTFATSLLVTGLLWAALVIRAALLPGDHSLAGPDPFNPIFFTVTILMDIVATASFLMLNMARSQEDLRVSELRYRNLADKLVRVNKKLTILSSITRHDIKNQLTALSAYLELSRTSLDNVQEASDYVQKEMRIARTMGEQIDFTKVYEEMGTTAPTWQNISDCVGRGVAALPMRDVKVEVDCRNLEIYADPLFERVLYNLLDNALKYGGNSMTTIRITSREVDAGLIVTCEDNGEGIAQEDKPYLFERGFGKNTGLGLFLSREILSITGITIAETGEPGKGARFEMVVPKGEYRFTDGT
jgi:signal transduction histidine kinase